MLYKSLQMHQNKDGSHLNEHTARGIWSFQDSKLHINYLELKEVFLALKEFQDLCLSNIVLIATDNTTVVAYMNKEGGMKSGPPCALLWRNPDLVFQETGDSQSSTHSRAAECHGKLSRLGQTIQTEWSLHPDVFQAICSRWHQLQVDLFVTRFNNKLSHFIALIHPIQWTIAYPVGADWPAKHQKRRPVFPPAGQSIVLVHSPDGMSYFLPV